MSSSHGLDSKYWCIVPAAGVGSRMGAAHPKQYLSLLDKTICEHTLLRLLSVPRIEKIIVCVSGADTWWPGLSLNGDPRILSVEGGGERCDSVLNGLHLLRTMAADSDWVLVHDVARPCVRVADIERLMQITASQQNGGILATPVRDTLKRSGKTGSGENKNTVAATVDRSNLWHALTPQLFRVGELTAALQGALQAGVTVTDEASAIEWQGGTPLLVEGHPDNIKITHPNDLPLALLFLKQTHN
ncbi:MAG: 2-C-methyl-D-erythritol 4-phosphate cytidylyltransferase [Gammaproteobacteria bacterium]|nr:MAG: 2-C-methyl-D-erythritol 4-phosphate cytidylyltransferase [Gammaproteobacteria bacterium]